MYHEVINDVALFIEVINEGSFSAASKKLQISKPSVSRRINNLETRLKTKLIKRTTRKLSLTEAGQVLYRQCKDFDLSFQTALQAITDLNKQVVGQLKVGIASYLANDERFSAAVAAFMAANPNIDIQIQAFTASKDIDIVKKDFHLYFTDQDMTSTRFTSTLLKQYPVKLAAAPMYLQLQGEPITPQELSQHQCLLHFLYEKPLNQWSFIQDDKLTSIKVSSRFSATRTNILMNLAKAGCGITMLPAFMLTDSLQSGELVTLLNDTTCQPAEVHITTYRRKKMPAKLQLFIQHISSWYEA
ncbi:MAG: LysR family transcriptional regulator [Coxiellaceae bacterium]|nr:LysR family transcriptional regulator [Coxiellaceae bacterium]